LLDRRRPELAELVHRLVTLEVERLVDAELAPLAGVELDGSTVVEVATAPAVAPCSECGEHAPAPGRSRCNRCRSRERWRARAAAAADDGDGPRAGAAGDE
jgi:hypothetical protein